MEELTQFIDSKMKDLFEDHPDYRDVWESLESVWPFNRYEFAMSNFLGRNMIQLETYLDVRSEYIARNLFLHLFEISAPRTFGERWAQGHLKELVPELEKPTRKSDPEYSGQYDFLLDGRVRIEVKASRAVDARSDEPLYMKALSTESDCPFWMNFQQIKTGCCHVFVWIAVWRDEIHYWVLSSNEVAEHPGFSAGQHRGNVGEGQLHVRRDNLAQFEAYRVEGRDLLDAIRAAAERQGCA